MHDAPRRAAVAAALLTAWPLATAAASENAAPPAMPENAAPPAMPTVDATVRYRVAPAGGTPEDVTVSFSGDGRFVRIEGPPGRGATILDRDERTITVVVPDPHVFMVVPTKGPITDPFMLGAGMGYSRTGTRETIAGTVCDDWRVATGKGDATACVTPSGILLAANGVDGAGARGSLAATAVSVAPIPPDRFAPPPGYRRIAHPEKN